MLKAKNVDITGGPLIKSMLLYALPIMMGSLIQVAFNAADLIVVGKLGGTAASAAVGAVAPVVNFLVNSFVGLSVGINAVLSRSLGQRDTERAGRVINTALISALVLGFVLMAVCFAFSVPLLKTLNCDEEYLEGAISYLNIYAIGIPAILIYNFAAAIIRSMGDTTRPFIYLVISGIVNVVLNLVLCLTLENKVAAVAIATTASQVMGAILTMRQLIFFNNGVGFNIKKLSFSFRELQAILKIGTPCAFNSALFSFSNLQMASTLNSYGTAATAGGAAATNIESVSSAVTTGFNGTIVPFVGQNLGANNGERVKKSILWGFILSTSISFVISMTIYIFGKQFLAIYLPNDPSGIEAIELGIVRMKYISRFYVIAAAYNVFLSAMQAFGYSFVPMINSIITVFVFRIFWLELIYPVLDAANHVIDNLYVCYTISWTLTLIAHSIMFIFVYSRYKKGKIKRI